MSSVVKVEFVDKNVVNMFVPQAGCFWMALKVAKDGDDISFRNRRPFEMIDPPFIELVVDFHVEGVFWWWGFGKSIGDGTT